jgi:glycosyltransferase involved in cell wall biosynthesis
MVECWHLPKVAGLMWMWRRQYARLFEIYVKRMGVPDIIHAHGFLAGIAARYLSRKSGIPYLITEHSTALPGKQVKWYHRKQLELAYQNASELVAVSNFLKDSMEKHCARKDIQVIPNPVDFSLFTPTIKHERDKHRLISVGSLESRKNYSLLLRALGEVIHQMDIELVIIGSGSRQRELQDEAAKLDIADNIRWMGDLSNADVAHELSVSDLFISTSNLETFGVAIVEALACGVPVIATRSGGPDEFIQKETGVLVPPDDVNALATCIVTILNRLDSYNPLTIRELSRASFDFPVIAGKVEPVYSNILATSQ